RPLHDYANLYFHARNPMMYKRRVMHATLAVLRVHPDVLDVPGVVIAPGNASSDWTGFWPSPDGLAKIDRELTFAEDWRDPDPITYYRKKSAKCAEVLVPDQVDCAFISGFYVSNPMALPVVANLQLPWPATVNAHMFFRG